LNFILTLIFFFLVKDEVEEVEDIDQSLLRGPAIRTYMVKAENNCTNEVDL